MKCIILCAGYATRLYPITENFPKPLLEVGGKTILDWLVDDIDTCGKVDGYIVVSNHKYIRHFREWASRKSLPVTVLDDGTESNETRLGAVSDILFAVDTLNLDEDLLVIAGDNLLDFSLAKFIDYALAKKTSCIMTYFEPDRKRRLKSAVVSVDEDDLVLSMTEKPACPEIPWCCPPFYYYIREDVRLIPAGIEDGCGTDSPGYYAAWLSSQTQLHAMEMPGSRYDIGTVENYENIKSEYEGIVN